MTNRYSKPKGYYFDSSWSSKTSARSMADSLKGFGYQTKVVKLAGQSKTVPKLKSVYGVFRKRNN